MLFTLLLTSSSHSVKTAGIVASTAPHYAQMSPRYYCAYRADFYSQREVVRQPGMSFQNGSLIETQFMYSFCTAKLGLLCDEDSLSGYWLRWLFESCHWLYLQTLSCPYVQVVKMCQMRGLGKGCVCVLPLCCLHCALCTWQQGHTLKTGMNTPLGAQH